MACFQTTNLPQTCQKSSGAKYATKRGKIRKKYVEVWLILLFCTISLHCGTLYSVFRRRIRIFWRISHGVNRTHCRQGRLSRRSTWRTTSYMHCGIEFLFTWNHWHVFVFAHLNMMLFQHDFDDVNFVHWWVLIDHQQWRAWVAHDSQMSAIPPSPQINFLNWTPWSSSISERRQCCWALAAAATICSLRNLLNGSCPRVCKISCTSSKVSQCNISSYLLRQ